MRRVDPALKCCSCLSLRGELRRGGVDFGTLPKLLRASYGQSSEWRHSLVCGRERFEGNGGKGTKRTFSTSALGVEDSRKS
jgi:hypothetical protein